MPQLQEINPRAVEALARIAELMRKEFAQANSFNNEFAQANRPSDELAEENSHNEERLATYRLIGCPLNFRHQELRAAIGRARGNLRRITAAHRLSIDSLLSEGKSGKRVQLPGGYEVAREFDELIIRRARQQKESEQDLELKLGEHCRLGGFDLYFLPVGGEAAKQQPQSDIAVVDLDLTGERLNVRVRQPGDRYRPRNCNSAEKLKNLMIENRIPVSERQAWPVVLTPGGEIIWTPRLPVSADFAARATTGRFAIILAK